MKKLMLLCGGFLLMGSLSAQSLGKGDMQLNGGLGTSGAGTMLYAAADFGVSQQITLGGELFYRGRTYGSVGYSNVGILFTSNFHFANYIPIPREIDLYGGLSLGYYSWSNDAKIHLFLSEYTSGLALRFQSGARYFFADNLAVNAEWFLEANGFSGGGLKAGITYRF